MPASITLSGLSCRAPDGTFLFENLDLAFGPVRTGLVGRNGVGKTTLLRLILGEIAPERGTIAIEGRVGALRQAVRLEDAETVGAALGLAPALARLARIEAGTGTEADFADADWTLEERVGEALDRTGLDRLDRERPVTTLSGGQRTRLSLARLLLEAPDMLLLDEPTNNLDADGRAAVRDLLASWHGGAIVVSHDRALLETVDAMVELTSLGATVYGGGYSHFAERKAVELAARRHDLETAEKARADIDRRVEAQRERKARTDSRGHALRARGDVPKILLNGMANRAQETGAAQARLANKRQADAGKALEEARAALEIVEPISMTLTSTGLVPSRTVLEATGLAGGPPDMPPLLDEFDLRLIGPERVAVTGPNGSGKTTLLRLLTGTLPPLAGTVRIHVPFAMLDQSVALLLPGETIRDNYRRLNPGEDENACRAALARFRFRADAALKRVGELSGGETIRAGLAATIGSLAPPALLVLDEPTNHLDLEAIAAVEAGLNAYDGALIVVSHDRAFLDAIGITRSIEIGGNT